MRTGFAITVILVWATIATATPLDLDLSQAAVWGPATSADSLVARTQEARWLEDADSFHRVLGEFWARHPHEPRAVEQVVLWYRGQNDLVGLRAAIAAGTAEEFTGLTDLDQDDLALMRGHALYTSGYHASAREVLEGLLATRPDEPVILGLLFQIARNDLDDPDRQAAIARTALAYPEASCRILGRIATSGAGQREFRYRDEARALIADRPARPHLEALLAGEAAIDEVRQPGLTAARLGALIDELRAERPATCLVYLDEILFNAVAWLPPAVLREVEADQAEWLTPQKHALCLAMILGFEDLGHGVNAALAATGGVPDGRILRVAADWHPDAAEVEAWARRLAAENLLNCWDEAMQILRERGHADAADSLRTLVAHESPFTHAAEQMTERRWSDPAAAGQQLDQLVASVGELTFGWDLLLRAETAGDHAFLAGYRQRHGPHAAMMAMSGAIFGAQNRADTQRLTELADLVRELAPANTFLLQTIARAFIEIDHPELARPIATALESLPPQPAAYPMLLVDVAMGERDPEAVEALLEQQLTAPDTPVDHLVLIPTYAEGAGWSDLADRSLARVETEAPADCRRMLMLQAEFRRLRGDLAGSREILLGLQVDWPGEERIRRTLVDAGGMVENYEDPAPELPVASLAGLSFDYTATDWIVAGRARPDEFPEDDVLVIRDQETYYLSSLTRLTTRKRTTVEILHESAVPQFATVRIPFDSDNETPRLLCARIILPDGEVREVPTHQVLVTAHQSEDADVSDRRDLVIPFAGLKPGMVVDYCYESSIGSFLELGHAWTYRFGNFAPQREEILEIAVAEGVEHMLYLEHQPHEPERFDGEGTTVYRWRLVDPEPVVLESGAPLFAFFPQWVGCTTYDSWDVLARHYGRIFWQQTTVTEPTRELALRLTAGIDRDDERIATLYTHLHDEIENIGISLGSGRFIPTPSHEVLDRGYGDCKDKVATLIALAGALEIECLPVLVGTRPALEVADDFPSSACFDHLIAYFPDLDGGTFSDPTLGTRCVDGLADEVAGQRGLLIDRDGKGKLVAIPEQNVDEPTVELTVDLYPEAGGLLRAEATALVRQVMGDIVRSMLDYPDSNVARSIVSMVAGNGAHEALHLAHWESRELDCGTTEIRAVFRDSVWASPDDNDAPLIWVAPADAQIELPEEPERTLPLIFDSAQRAVLVLRAHETLDWRLSTRHSPIKVSAPGFKGEVKVESRREGDDRWLEIRREVTFSRREYPAKDFGDLRDAFFSYRLAGFQSILYQRQSDEARLAQLREYCRENPEDLAFAFQASIQVLGGDMGGDGEAGAERRKLARELLAPALEHPQAGGMPYLLAASIAVEDSHYLEADSLATIGLERAPHDPYLLGFAIQIALELGDDERLVEHLLTMRSLTGNEALSYALITQYLAMERDDDAAREESRLGLIAAEVDSAEIVTARINGYTKSNRLDRVYDLLPTAERLLDPFQYRLQTGELAARERRWDDAIEEMAPVHSEYPLHPMFNNNMAWYLGCAGRDLERAEYLARMSIALSDDPTPTNNTLGVVLMQQGKLDEAREIFAELMQDERPSHRMINGYFWGLCRWFENKRDEAVECWRGIEDLAGRDEYGVLLHETLAAVAAGEDPAWLFLWPVAGED